MLTRVDRVQIAVEDREPAERVVAEIFGGELIRRDEAGPLGAERSTMLVGESLIELLQPAGAGRTRDFVARWGGGLMGVGFAVADLDRAESHLNRVRAKFERAGGQLFLDPAATFGLGAVISADHQRKSAGAVVRHIYEVTNVVGDWRKAADRYEKLFALDASKFHPITSGEFGYTGTLTMFAPPARLDRIEIAAITDGSKAMGRFHQKRGDSLYMFFAEAGDLEALARRLESRGAAFQPWRRDKAGLAELFIHPSAFLGVLAGVSRTDQAWRWSGDPERARRAATARSR
jgi:Glyoxalase/Bleomycin resistance protein/Dioxygenase superfamily